MDRSRLYVGEELLDRYLIGAGLGWVVKLARLIADLDVYPFRAKYKGTGRHPHHPHAMIGLVVYGALQGKTSLRELEQLALVDVGAWWLCAGHQPDHSAIGRFLVRHREHLTDDFFLEVTRKLLAREKIQVGTIGVDGTVIEAVASRLKTLRVEVLKERLDDEKERVAKGEGDAVLVDKLETAVSVGTERQENRNAVGKEGQIKLAADEPEAVHQPLKNGLNRASYKPVIATHESGYVVGQTVEPSNENAALPKLMAQHETLFSTTPKRALMDSGFFCATTLKMMIEADVDLLCPPRGMLKDDVDGDDKRYGKERFIYEANRDVYRCPAGKELVAIERGKQKRGGAYQKYGCRHCGGCEQRARCTSSAYGRTIKRFTEDDAKEAMRAVLGDRRAQAAYRKRQHIAETPHATIKNVQGLTRFGRRGLRGARLEIAIHCIALNFGRAVRAALVLVTVNNRLVAATTYVSF